MRSVLVRVKAVGTRLAARLVAGAWPWLEPVLTRLRPAGRALKTVTPLGWTVVAVSVAALVAGVAAGWLELLIAGTTGLLTTALCVLFTLSRGQVSITLDPNDRRFREGRSTTVGISVRNEGAARLSSMVLEVMVGGAPMPFQMENPPAGQPWTHSFPVYGARRGVLRVGPATTLRTDPLGLLEKRNSDSEIVDLFIHPEWIPLSPLGTGLLRDLEGRPTKDLSMADLAFHTMRDYEPGDDRRYIHWRSSARRIAAGYPPLVKQFQDTRRTQLLIVVDGSRDAYKHEDEFELAIRVGASLAMQAVRDDIEMIFICADQEVRRTPTRRLARHVVLDACARADYTHRSLAKLVSNAVSKQRETTYAFIVTGSRAIERRLEEVASKVPGETRTNVLRIDPAGERRMWVGTTMSLLTVTELKDLHILFPKGDQA